MNYRNIVIIGSSAGGPRILKELFIDLPRLNGCFVIVQHMPKFVNESLCDNLNQNTEMDVKIACTEEPLLVGSVYIAPSEKHLKLVKNREIMLVKGEKINFACPSIDVTMKSVVEEFDKKIIGIVLSGMGKDGAEGICHIKQIGGITIAQNEETSIIFGMPKEAINTGQIDMVYSTIEIKEFLVKTLGIQR